MFNSFKRAAAYAKGVLLATIAGAVLVAGAPLLMAPLQSALAQGSAQAATVYDFAPWLDMLFTAATGAISAVGAVAVALITAWIKRKFDIDLDAKYVAMLHDAIPRAIAYAEAEARQWAAGKTAVDMKSRIAVMALRYLEENKTDAVEWFSKAKVETVVKAYLETKLAAV